MPAAPVPPVRSSRVLPGSRPGTPVRTPPAAAPKAAAKPETQYYDVSFSVGLLGSEIRLTVESYENLQFWLLLAARDVLLVGNFKTHERQIILRGSQNIDLTVRPMDPGKKLPLCEVLDRETHLDLMLERLASRAE